MVWLAIQLYHPSVPNSKALIYCEANQCQSYQMVIAFCKHDLFVLVLSMLRMHIENGIGIFLFIILLVWIWRLPGSICRDRGGVCAGGSSKPGKAGGMEQFPANTGSQSVWQRESHSISMLSLYRVRRHIEKERIRVFFLNWNLELVRNTQHTKLLATEAWPS